MCRRSFDAEPVDHVPQHGLRIRRRRGSGRPTARENSSRVFRHAARALHATQTPLRRRLRGGVVGAAPRQDLQEKTEPRAGAQHVTRNSTRKDRQIVLLIFEGPHVPP